jgi:type IV secretory pathway VirB2 component (pilin)
MKKTISIFLFSLIFFASTSFVFAAGETTANPFVPGSGGMSQSTQQGTPTGGGSQSSGFGNPIGVDSIEGVLGNVMSYLQGIAGAIAVIFIIIGGIMYMISGGSKEMSERAKKTLIFAIVGLAIVLAAPLFYQEIKAVLSGNNPGSALQQLLLNILKLLLSIVGFLAIISMVVGAIWMFTAVGDEDKYELGKKMAGYSIFGLVIALSSLIIANQVTNLIGG